MVTRSEVGFRQFGNVVIFFKDIFQLEIPLDVTSINFSIYFCHHTLLIQQTSDIDEPEIRHRCFKTSNGSIEFDDLKNR